MELGIIHVENTAAGAPATIPEGHLEYHKDTDRLYKSDGTTKTELASSSNARIPSVVNPPASTHAYSDEFLSGTKDAKWTAYNVAPAAAPVSGTVNLINSIGVPVYDATTMPSHMLFQSDNTSLGLFGLMQTVTTGTNATIFVRMFSDNKVFSTAAEGSIMVTLYNAASPTNYVSIGLANNTGAGQTTKARVVNAGVLTLNYIGAVRNEGNPLIESLFCIRKFGNVYYFHTGTEGSSIMTLVGTATKSGVTTLDTLKIECTTANETPSTVYAVDFIRWYDSVQMSLVNE